MKNIKTYIGKRLNLNPIYIKNVKIAEPPAIFESKVLNFYIYNYKSKQMITDLQSFNKPLKTFKTEMQNAFGGAFYEYTK